jgi:hypothetical protein
MVEASLLLTGKLKTSTPTVTRMMPGMGTTMQRGNMSCNIR